MSLPLAAQKVSVMDGKWEAIIVRNFRRSSGNRIFPQLFNGLLNFSSREIGLGVYYTQVEIIEQKCWLRRFKKQIWSI